MIIKKFIERDRRRAMAKVRDEFGSDALVLSSRVLDDGFFEMVVGKDYDACEVVDPVSIKQAQPATPDSNASLWSESNTAVELNYSADTGILDQLGERLERTSKLAETGDQVEIHQPAAARSEPAIQGSKKTKSSDIPAADTSVRNDVEHSYQNAPKQNQAQQFGDNEFFNSAVKNQQPDDMPELVAPEREFAPLEPISLVKDDETQRLFKNRENRQMVESRGAVIEDEYESLTDLAKSPLSPVDLVRDASVKDVQRQIIDKYAEKSIPEFEPEEELSLESLKSELASLKELIRSGFENMASEPERPMAQAYRHG